MCDLVAREKRTATSLNIQILKQIVTDDKCVYFVKSWNKINHDASQMIYPYPNDNHQHNGVLFFYITGIEPSRISSCWKMK